MKNIFLRAIQYLKSKTPQVALYGFLSVLLWVSAVQAQVVSPVFWTLKDGTALVPVVSTWTIGNESNPIAGITATELNAGTINIGGAALGGLIIPYEEKLQFGTSTESGNAYMVYNQKGDSGSNLSVVLGETPSSTALMWLSSTSTVESFDMGFFNQFFDQPTLGLYTSSTDWRLISQETGEGEAQSKGINFFTALSSSTDELAYDFQGVGVGELSGQFINVVRTSFNQNPQTGAPNVSYRTGGVGGTTTTGYQYLFSEEGMDSELVYWRLFSSYEEGIGAQLNTISTPDVFATIFNGIFVPNSLVYGGQVEIPGGDEVELGNDQTIIFFDSSIAGNATTTLPNTGMELDGKLFKFFDEGGSANVNNLIIEAGAGDTIYGAVSGATNGSTQCAIDDAYGSMSLVFRSGGWLIESYTGTPTCD